MKINRYRLYVGPFRALSRTVTQRQYCHLVSADKIADLEHHVWQVRSETYQHDQGPSNPDRRYSGFYIVDTKTGKVVEEAEFDEIMKKVRC